MAQFNGTANPGTTGANGSITPTPSSGGGHSQETLYKAVKSQQRFEKLHSRFSGGKSFAEENAKWKTVAVVTSYLINALSIAGAFYGAVWLFGWFGAGKEVSYILSAALLLMVEIGRRWAADFIWDKWFLVGKVAGAFLALNIALFIVSATSSGFGIYRGIVDNAQPAPTLSDSTLIKMEGEAAAIRGDIETAKKTKWKGTVTVDAQRAIKSSTKSLATLTDAITERRAKLSGKQETAETEHKADIETVGLIAVLIYLFLEIVFQICVRFVSLYDYREFLGRTQQGQKSIAPTPSAAALQIDEQTLRQLVGNARTGGVHNFNIVAPGFGAFMGQGQQAQTSQADPKNRAGNGSPKPPQTDPHENGFSQLAIAQTDQNDPSTNPANRQPQTPQTDPKTGGVVYVPTDIFIEHENRQTGKVKRLNITQVRSNLAANFSRLKRATDPTTAANIESQVNYWKCKERELIAKYSGLEKSGQGRAGFVVQMETDGRWADVESPASSEQSEQTAAGYRQRGFNVRVVALAFALFVVALSGCTTATHPAPATVPDVFQSIPDNRGNFRSPQPTPGELQQLAASGAIDRVVRMNGGGKDSGGVSLKLERDICTAHGIGFVFINAHGKGAAGKVRALLLEGRTLVHCRHGFDRTGGVVGYHLRREGWTAADVVGLNNWKGYIERKGRAYQIYYDMGTQL